MLDYIIIGFGLAGSALSSVLEAKGKSFMVIDDGEKSASRVAAGICNPVVIKRLKRVWNAPLFLEEARRHYKDLEKKLQISAFNEIDLYRRIGTAQEQNNWLVAADREELKPFLSDKILKHSVGGLAAPYGYGAVKQVNRLDVSKILDAHYNYLFLKGAMSNETFRFSELRIGNSNITFKNIKARRIVYATGIRALELPVFKNIPVIPSKGDYLLIEAHELKSEAVLNAGLFIVPEGDGRYRVGATYENENNWTTSNKAAEAIRRKLAQLKIPYRCISQTTGVRPTVPDRRPLIGEIPGHAHGYVINGLGSRGVMMAPSLANLLYSYIEEGRPIWPETDVSRYVEIT